MADLDVEPAQRVGSMAGRTTRRRQTINGWETCICQLDAVKCKLETAFQAITNQGASTHSSRCQAYLFQRKRRNRPLYADFASQTIPLDVLAKIAEIALESQHRQYQKANDAYLRLSIGTAAWPIGVTSVGMHERGARERIYQDGVAHVLNDEVSRKWIQAMKR